MRDLSPCLLLVEDRAGLLHAPAMALAGPLGVRLVTAGDLTEAESRVSRGEVQLLLVDGSSGALESADRERLARLAERVAVLVVVADEREKSRWSRTTGAAVLTLNEAETGLAGALLRLAVARAEACRVEARLDQGALRRAESEKLRLATAVECAAESIMITNRDGVIEYVNPAFEKNTGYRREEVVGQTPRILKSGQHPPEFYAQMWETLRRGQVWTGHLTNKHKDGSLMEVEATISSLLDRESGSVTGYVAVQRDVTQEQGLARQLQHAQRMEALGQLAGGVAHDFNNVLTAILGSLALALHTPLPERARSLLVDAERASLRAAELVKQLLTFSRNSETVLRPIAVDEVIREVAGIARNTFDRRIEISELCAADLRPVLADAGQLHQVLLNLCVNARDALEAMPRSRRAAPLRLTLEAENALLDEDACRSAGVPRPGPYVRISVSDNGIGMPEEVRKRVFDPFFTTKDKGKGTGLGLATVYGIVKQHEGGVSVYSEPGFGTTFKVHLPAAATGSRNVAIPAEDAPSRGTETILLVDDEEIIRALCSSVLSRHGYKVMEAADGREALSVYAQHERDIDLVILDLSMPNLSGMETLERLRAFRPDVRVILSSGYSLDPTHELLQQPCVSGFIPKPYQPSELVRMVRGALDQPAGSA